MQIHPFSSAALAAGIVSQSTSKDKASSGTQATSQVAPAASETHVEQAGTSNPDRDAQGQGDGLPGDAERTAPQQTEPQQQPDSAPASLLPGEEPGQLDITG